MKKNLSLMIAVIAVLFGLAWLYSHSFIEIKLSDYSGGEVAFEIRNQSTGDLTEIKSVSGTAKKLVAKGSYEVLARQGDKSYFTVIKAGGFLSTAKTSGQSQQERARSFVGNNPRPCMHYDGKILISYSCNSVYSNMVIHKPATAAQATHTLSPQRSETELEGIVESPEGKAVILRAPELDEEDAPAHTAFLINDTLTLGDEFILNDLAADKAYTSRKYKQGFLLYDKELTDIFYYSSLKTQPSRIVAEKSSDPNLKPFLFNYNNDSFMFAYSDSEDQDLDDVNAKVKTEVIIKKGNQSKKFIFKRFYSSIEFCGTDKLCALGSEKVDVFDITGKEAKLKYSVRDVEAIKTNGDKLILATPRELIELDVDKSQGYVQYSLGNYTYCGFSEGIDGYTICLTNNRQSNIALRIDTKNPNTDSIDKKIYQLLSVEYVQTVSIYGKFIYFTPDLGEPIYDEASGEYTIDQQKKKTAEARIQAEIDKIGIDRSAYIIKSSLD
jgi:hypothetical protein